MAKINKQNNNKQKLNNQKNNNKYLNESKLKKLTKTELINLLLKPHRVTTQRNINKMRNTKIFNKQKQNKKLMLNELKQK